MRLSVLMFVVLFAALSLTACGGSTTKSTEPEKVETGSLLRSYKLVDEQGRESGTLVLNPLGGAELRDVDGKVIGSFAPKQEADNPVEKPVEKEPAADKEEAGTSDKDKDDDAKDK